MSQTGTVTRSELLALRLMPTHLHTKPLSLDVNWEKNSSWFGKLDFGPIVIKRGSHRIGHHRGRELAYASPPAQIPACALTHGAPASDDDEGQLARLRGFKPIAVTRETPTQSRLRKCVLHCLVGSAEWSFPPTVGICGPGDTNGGYPCWVSGTRY